MKASWLRRSGVAVSLFAVLLTTGCTQGLYGVPLPGGADLGARPYRVTVGFADVLDLVPQSGVKVNDIAVGKVEEIRLSPDGRTARVTLAVNPDVQLPANAVARLRQTSLLGEKFVELAAPDNRTPRGRLSDGDSIPVALTNRNTEVEEVFGALSLLLNGGGIGQIQNITQELNDALGENEESAQNLLSNLDTFIHGLDEHRSEITRALDSVNRLAKTLRSHQGEISTTLNDLTPGIEALSQQREDLVRMLKSVAELSDVAVDTVHKTKDDLVADLRALEPTLRKLAESGAALPKSMQTLLTFPFPDVALDAIKGDYLNTYIDLNTRTAGATPASTDQPPAGSAQTGPILPLPAADSPRSGEGEPAVTIPAGSGR